MYLYFATGITWRLLLLIPIYTASMNYARLVIACVHLLLLLLLVALTVIRCSKNRFPSQSAAFFSSSPVGPPSLVAFLSAFLCPACPVWSAGSFAFF